jgi:Zn-dependent peptidase ImmA (M78 family)
MHRSFYRSPEPSAGLAKDNQLETMANQFAACLLVPEVGLRLVFRRDVAKEQAGVEDVIHLKHLFHVSAEMMLRRLTDLSLITRKDADRLTIEFDKNREPKREFMPLSERIIEDWEAHGRFHHLLRRAFLGGLLSIDKIAELLNVTRAQAREFSRTWDFGTTIRYEA